MNYRLTLHTLGGLLLVLAAALLTPVPVSLFFRDGLVFAFLASATAVGATGFAMRRFIAAEGDFGIREGFAIASLGWIAFSLFGGLPYAIGGIVSSPIDIWFETVSGFTTTGATILTRLDDVPKSILYWRAMTQFLGGMGIVLLSLAILPMLGVGGMQLFRAEIPGPTKDRLTPRIQDTARILWIVYMGLTVTVAVLLGLGGMSWFDAICHAMTTTATAGFSTKDASVGYWQSSYIHAVITVFMLISGVNFALHYVALRRGFRAYWNSEEFRIYSGLTVVAIVAVWLTILPQYESAAIAFRDASFNVATIVTTSGFSTVDFELWPLFSQGILVALMLTGAMAGSTSGGIKIVRIVLISKHVHLQAFRLIHPRGIRFNKLNGKTVPDDVIHSILGFCVMYMLLALASILAILATGVDFVTAATGVISAISNIGPGLGTIGPSETYAHLPGFAKWVLSVCMLFGRLELFTILVLFLPSFWRR